MESTITKSLVDPELTVDEIRTIVKEAYIYGFPIVDNMRIQYTYFVDQKSSEYKAPYNNIFNIPRVYTPKDKAVQTPNSDTPYSWIGLDLRHEPVIFSAPQIEENRYWSLQLIDLYTHNFAYVGSRTTGNKGGSFAIVGPDWKGKIPDSIDKVILCETVLACALVRTQLFNPEDLDNVINIQKKYIVKTLSAYIGSSTDNENREPINFPTPLSTEEQKSSINFFSLLNFYLQFCPVHPTEVELMKRFTKVGIGAGLELDENHLTDEQQQAFKSGISDAWTTFSVFKKEQVDTGKKPAADGFGTREFLNNDYMSRMSSAFLGIYGNSKEEALYPFYYVDADGKPLIGEDNYELIFKKGALPPVHSFWSITMYELPSSLLTENPINRYLINSSMILSLVKNEDESITIKIQHASPGKEWEANWLPAPKGPFWVTMRLYWPKEEALTGSWKQPSLIRIK